MRYYSIEIRDKDGDLVVPGYAKKLNLNASYTSFVNGQSLPGALDIELNIPLYNYAFPKQGAMVRIFGVSLEEVSQANDLEGYSIVIKGGMQKGLPLAKPSQNGLILRGTIFQSYGNVEGVERVLNLILTPSTGTIAKPKNISLNWRARQPLSEALQTTLTAAFPEYTVRMAISSDLVMSSDQPGTFGKLEELSAAVLRLTRAQQFKGIKTLSGATYGGVDITIKDKVIVVYDKTTDFGGTTYDDPKQLLFEDMLGQPTWLDPGTINVRLVLRADLDVGGFIKMPQKLPSNYAIFTQTAQLPADTPSRNKSIFQGTFAIRELFHFGRFRQSDAASWVTSVNAVALPKAA